MGLQLLAFRASDFVPWPGEDDDPASESQFTLAEAQRPLFEEQGYELRAPLAVLLPEGWDAHGSLPFSGWIAPPAWDPRVTRINQDVLRYAPDLLRERLPEALIEAAKIVDVNQRQRISAILSRVVDAVASAQAGGDPLYLSVSA